MMVAGCSPEERMSVLLARHPGLAQTSRLDSVTVQDSAGVRVVTQFRYRNTTMVLDGQRARNELKAEQGRNKFLREQLRAAKQEQARLATLAHPRFYQLTWFWVALLLAVLLVGSFLIRVASFVNRIAL